MGESTWHREADSFFLRMHDEHPFCQKHTERRRTTVKFLGQQNEMTIDDTKPHTGETRSLWKVVLHLGHIRRESHMSVVSHTEDAEERGRRVVLGFPELSNVYSTHHDDSSCATTPQDAAVEASKPGPSTTGFQRRDAVIKPSAMAREREARANCGAIISDKGDITGTSKAIQRRLMTAEITPHSNRTVVETHRTGPSAGRDRQSEEIAGGSPSRSTTSPEQSDRSSMPSGRGDGRNRQDQKV